MERTRYLGRARPGADGAGGLDARLRGKSIATLNSNILSFDLHRESRTGGGRETVLFAQVPQL